MRSLIDISAIKKIADTYTRFQRYSTRIDKVYNLISIIFFWFTWFL